MHSSIITRADRVSGAMKKKRRVETVLIIEDDADVQKFVSRVLELEGHKVIRASNGEEGMAIIQEAPVSLMLLDLRLPGRDGWSVLQEMKRRPELAQIPVVVLTAVAESPQRKRALRMGATEYLVKPMSAHSVARSIARILQRSGKSHHIPPTRHHAESQAPLPAAPKRPLPQGHGAGTSGI